MTVLLSKGTTPDALDWEYDGRRVSANVRRSGDAWIFFLHGLGCAKESFDGAFAADELREYSLCALDFPGHGHSARFERSAYCIESYADVLNKLISHLAPDELNLVCHSLGGADGLVATQGQVQPRTLVSVEGNLVAEDCGIVSRETAAQSLRQFTDKGFPGFAEALTQSSRQDLRAWAEWYRVCDPIAVHETARSLVEWSDSGKLIELFRGLPRKAYVYGDEDDRMDYLLPRLKDVPTLGIPRSGHFPMVDDARSFYRAVAECVAQAD